MDPAEKADALLRVCRLALDSVPPADALAVLNVLLLKLSELKNELKRQTNGGDRDE